MKKQILIIITLLLAMQPGQSFAQGFWAKQVGGSAADKGDGILTDAAGNVYTIGTFSMTCDFDPSVTTFTMASSGNLDVFITKFNSAGNFLWAKKIGGPSADEVADFTFDASGNIYIVGNFMSTCDFDPGPSTFTMTAPVNVTSTSDIFVLKLDNNGNFVWAKQMGSQWWDTGTSIALDASGNPVLAGYFSTTSSGPADFDPGPFTYTFTTGTSGGNTDIALVKLTSAGNFVWAKQIGGPSGDYGFELQIDNSGNIYMGGYFSGTTDFDPNAGVSNLVSLGFEDVYVLKLDNNANFMWARNWGSNTVDYGRSIALDASGNVYCTGSFRASCDFDPGPGTYTLVSVSGDDIFVSKLDANGNFMWARSMGSTSADVGNSIATDASGNVYTTGIFRLSTDFNPGPGTYSLTTFGNADVFIHKMDAAGNFLWAGQMGGSLDDFGYGITVNASGIVYTTGYFQATADMDPTSNMLNLTSYGQTDAFVQRMCQPASQPGPISGTFPACNGAMQTYSVPSLPGATAYTWNFPAGWTGTSSSNSVNAVAGNSGMITVTATNTCGISVPQTLSVTVNPAPSVVASASSSMICSGQSATLIAGGANTYTWNTSAQTQIIIVSPAGNATYTVTGTDANGCTGTATLSLLVSACTGINTLTDGENAIQLYPNPVADKVSLQNNFTEGIIRIYDMTGKTILTQTILPGNNELDLASLRSGMYIISLTSQGKNYTSRMIRE